MLVWAGADAPDVVADLPAHRRVANVLDRHLRPHLAGLAGAVREVYVGDLVDAKGLGALADVTSTQIWPTPAVVGLAAQRMTKQPVPPAPTVPFVLVDAGGATTDVFVCAELRPAHAARSAPGESVVRHVFTDLGVAASRPALLQRLGTDPDLLDLVAAVAPGRSRALYTALGEGAPEALDPPYGFLSCLFLALRRLAGPEADLSRAASFVVTGGACGDTPVAAVRRVVDAARGRPVARDGVLLDRDYLLWAYGLQDVPDRPVED